MAEIAQHVRALREGDDAAKTAAARELGSLAWNNNANQVAIAEAGGIPPLVELLRDGSAEAKYQAASALGEVQCNNNANRVLIVEASGIPPLVDLLRDGSAQAKLKAARAAHDLTYYGNAANRVLIVEAGGIPPLVELLRDGIAYAKSAAAWTLRYLADNDANAVAIAAAVGLARRGRVTSEWVRDPEIVSNAALPAKRKAALVVAELLRDFVSDSVPREIKALIGTYL